MNKKQIFAAIEVTDHEIHLIVGEFFNTRFNIIKVERVPVRGLTYDHVTDPEAITKAIRKAADNVENLVGAAVQKVILAIPSYNMERKSLKSTVPVTGIDGTVTIEDVRKAVRKARKYQLDDAHALIQTVCVRYTVNGITSRRIPLNEKANALTVEIDLLAADKQLAYDLVSCVEKSGLQVMSIYLDIYAAAKEAALFEQAVNQNVILLKLERDSTTLGLLSHGKLATCMIHPAGIGDLARAVHTQYGLQEDVACELIKYSAKLDEDSHSDYPIHIWSEHDKARKISEKELCTCIQAGVEKWLGEMEQLCSPILQAGPTVVIITGEGGEMQGLNVELQRRLGCEVRNYIPETLGGRNAGLTACLGLFYAYQDNLPISGNADSSIDLDAFMKSVSYRDKEKSENQEDTFTKKLMGLFDGHK